jgi:hypothetical protein
VTPSVSFPLHTTVEDRIASHLEIRQIPRSEVPSEELHPSEIDRMGPERHLPAGYGDGRKRAGEIVASRFSQAEGDGSYDFGWLAREHHDDRYLPAADEPEDSDGDGHQGHHRTWVAQLNYAEWLVFAHRYLIELDEHGLPVRYEDTLGSFTEYGPLFAVRVDNHEGWDSPGTFTVLDSSFYLSFASPQPQEASHAPAPERQATAGA